MRWLRHPSDNGNLRAVELLLGHTKKDSTVRYFGVEFEHALAIAEAIGIYPLQAAFVGGPRRTLTALSKNNRNAEILGEVPGFH